MNPVKGTHLVCSEIAKALGIDPARCKHFSLDFPPGGVVTVNFTLYPTHEQLAMVKDLIVPVAEGIEKRDNTEQEMRIEAKEKQLIERLKMCSPGLWATPPTNDETRKQIIGDVVEEFAGVADPVQNVSNKPTYAEAFVNSFISAEELQARTQKTAWGEPLRVMVKRVETPEPSEQIPTPPEPADEPKKINFREFF